MPKGKKWIIPVVVVMIALFAGFYYYNGPFAITQPSTNVKAGDVVQFDAREYMDCGICDMSRYRSHIDGYRIKVYNANGNLVKDEAFPNWEVLPGQWAYRCGEYANFVYYYTVPENPPEGTWTIRLEIAVDPISPYVTTDCIVAIDEGKFTVGTTCANKVQEIKYCVDANTRYYKPANSCNVIYTNCDDTYGTGYKCLNGECEQVEVCGDDLCDDFENPYNCYVDCGRCGDNICNPPYETPDTCPQDCSDCGDGICDKREEFFCPQDCADCGDGECMYGFENIKDSAYYCEADCGGDSVTVCAWWDIPCHITEYLKKLFVDLVQGFTEFFFPLIVIASIIGALLTMLISKDALERYAKGSTLTVISIIIGLLIGAVIFLYFWVGILMLIVYLVITMFIPKIRR